MMRGRRPLLLVAALLAMALLLAQPALAADQESGTLACKPGQVVVITERTSAGLTVINFDRTRRSTFKRDWSTTTTRTGLQSTSWQVTTSGQMDHAATGASCAP
jgi:hypothetical protein